MNQNNEMLERVMETGDGSIKTPLLTGYRQQVLPGTSVPIIFLELARASTPRKAPSMSYFNGKEGIQGLSIPVSQHFIYSG